MRIEGSGPNGVHGLPNWTTESNALHFQAQRALRDYMWENCDHELNEVRCTCATDFIAIALSLYPQGDTNG